MYGTPHSLATMNGLGGEVIDGSGTIDPANLSNSEDQGRRKRGRPPKIPRASSNDQAAAGTPIQTPQMQARPLPQNTAGSPPLGSPPDKTTPTKSLVKALPTVRDHTSDQLNDEGDEYIPKEFDDQGETKVDAMGYLQGSREYKCRTFRVPHRGTKLFMLATECARVLNYRDSYLLFNKNRSLHKIIASQVEKDDLIQQDILPYSYRSRQIAIVSARSMFRQFGSRVIVNGRRVRDDYWESKARKQGFTEDDLAGEKRPGAAKVRDGSTTETTTSSLLPALPHNDVIFSNTIEPLPAGLSLDVSDSPSLAQHSMIHMATTDDPRLRDYNSMPRMRQELTGPTYQDRSQPSSGSEIINQASHAAEFNKILASQRNYRKKGLEDFYSKPREAPETEPQSTIALDSGLSVSQPIQPAQIPPVGMPNQSHAQHVIPHQAAMMQAQQAMPQQTHQQPIAQPNVRAMPGYRPDLMHQRSNPSISAGVGQPPYVYPSQQQQQPQQQMWGQPPPQPQPSQMSPSAPQGVGMPQYAQHMAAPPQQTQSPLHHAQQPQQSPRNQHRPQVPQMAQQFQQMQHQQAQQQAMGAMGFPGGNAAAYQNAMARSMYPAAQGAPGGQPFMGGNPQQAGMPMGMGGAAMPGWPTGPAGQMQPGQPQPGQSGSPLGGWSGY